MNASKSVCGAAVSLALCVLLTACEKKFDPAKGVVPASPVEESTNGSIVTVDKPEQFTMVTATQLEAPAQLNVTGAVNPDIAREVPAISLASGRIVAIRARLDDNVKKGQRSQRLDPLTTHTVLHNLTEGIILVIVILFLFLGNVRGAVIVALTIPFSLLFAAICLDLKHIPANLLSLGALDFGMVVDGSVVMVENIVRHLSHQRDRTQTPAEMIREAAHEVQRPVFYAIGIIITAYLPIFTLQAVEGRLFRPMAWTVAFALLGALIFSIIIAPVLSGFLFRKGAREWTNPVMQFLIGRYRRGVTWAIHHRALTVGVGITGLALAVFLAVGGMIGSEFLPHLDEGSLWVRGTLAQSAGSGEGVDICNKARILLCSYPEATQCTSQTGRPDDGTDHTGFFNTEYFVGLKPKEQWRSVFHQNKDDLIASMTMQLEKNFPGVVWGFSQPIEDN
jgi:cobalt-zinc-cadmium resistance protein CzcA